LFRKYVVFHVSNTGKTTLIIANKIFTFAVADIVSRKQIIKRMAII